MKLPYAVAEIVASAFSSPLRTTHVGFPPLEYGGPSFEDDKARQRATTNRAKRVQRALLRPVVVTPQFKLVFLSVVLITILSAIAQIMLASMWDEPTANQQATFEAMAFAWKVGIGAIVGLLGGKVT